MTALLAVRERLGDGAPASLAAEKATTADTRLGAIRRMRTGLHDAARLLTETVRLLTTAHGNATLGVDGAISRSTDGTPGSVHGF
ncbi:hypothetical protein ACFU7Y_31725 [Kitasatospora sp. NPDC057542]|uniref:hypothetical protein n=1 Tax=Streptomycetaceae TaxID=2062 RepID=UPI001CCF9B34|nr:hypothetical protein [Streptomyces sp. LS1784]